MQSLGIALKARGEEGSALPNPMRALDRVGVKFTRSQLSLIAGAPGMGKSSLATWLVTRMKYPDGQGVPTLYLSADADRLTVAKSVVSGFTGKTQAEAERLILAQDLDVEKLMHEQISHVWWSFETLPSLSDINDEVDAYAYVHGEYPHMIVVDNLMDVSESGEDLHLVSDVQVMLKKLARRTEAHVMALSHVKGQWTDGLTPVPRNGLMYNIDKKPELILTTHQVQPGVMGLRVVKNRTGPAATNATYGVDIGWQPEFGAIIG